MLTLVSKFLISDIVFCISECHVFFFYRFQFSVEILSINFVCLFLFSLKILIIAALNSILANTGLSLLLLLLLLVVFLFLDCQLVFLASSHLCMLDFKDNTL